MKKELGKWLLDISKYAVTALFISNLVGKWENANGVYLVGGIIILITLFGGLFLIKENGNKF
ncbi:MAG: hypothetical protein LBF08_03525 [Dysgonamonadaceae bacterium]|jgi:hypothetical protein|nr:hypothetical protein [Dysgonamonadaceae bacterium]